jgi:hypothetical protein
MGYTNNDIMVGIWSNFTLVEGFMAHSKKQLDCAKKHRKNKKSKEDKVKDKNLPRLNLVKSSNKQISAYDDLD